MYRCVRSRESLIVDVGRHSAPLETRDNLPSLQDATGRIHRNGFLRAKERKAALEASSRIIGEFSCERARECSRRLAGKLSELYIRTVPTSRG